MLDRDHPLLAEAGRIERLRLMGKRLAGAGGVLIVTAPGRDAGLEDHLRSVFPSLHLVDLSQGGALYLAAKARFDVDAGRARLLAVANAAGASDLLASLARVNDLVRAPREDAPA